MLMPLWAKLPLPLTNPYVEALSPNVMVAENGAFGW